MREYNGKTIPTSQACTYDQLKQTYDGKSVDSNMMADPSIYDIPDMRYNSSVENAYPPRYDALTHGVGYQCGGHFGLKNAYPGATCTSCSAKRTTRKCDGNFIQ
jgi:hypothetical protein